MKAQQEHMSEKNEMSDWERDNKKETNKQTNKEEDEAMRTN